MDGRRIERLTKDLLAAEGLPFEFLTVRYEDGHVNLVFRKGDEQLIEITFPSTTEPSTVRELVRRRLEAEC